MQTLKKISGKSIIVLILLFTFNFSLLSFNLFANPKASSKQLLRLQVYNINTPEYFDETVIYFDSNATPSFNPYHDAFKLMNTAKALPNLYVLADIDTFAIKALPSLKKQQVIVPIGLKVNFAGVYKILATEILNFPDKIDIFLIDSITHTRLDLRKTPMDTFSYKHGLPDGRFFIEFSPKAEITTNISQTLSKSPDQFNIYVNDNTLNINYNKTVNENSSSFVSVYNVMGQSVIYNSKLDDTSNSFYLTRGTYFVKIITSGLSKPCTKKIIIK